MHKYVQECLNSRRESYFVIHIFLKSLEKKKYKPMIGMAIFFHCHSKQTITPVVSATVNRYPRLCKVGITDTPVFFHRLELSNFCANTY